MIIIGVTGGVGSGKSTVLDYLKETHNAYICKADIVARNLEKKGTRCYRRIVEHFGESILDENNRINRGALAAVVFQDQDELLVLNSIVHPAVKERIKRLIKEKEKEGVKIFVLEAALLLDDHYDEMCDQVWFIKTNEFVRRARLRISRGYSDEKIDAIIASQKTEQEFVMKCSHSVDNSDSFDQTASQIDTLVSKLNII